MMSLFLSKKSFSIVEMYHPSDQTFESSVTIKPKEFRSVLAPIVEESLADSNSNQFQDSNQPPVFSEKDVTESGWQKSENDDTAPTNTGNSISEIAGIPEIPKGNIANASNDF